jgi:hypothetical protein
MDYQSLSNAATNVIVAIETNPLESVSVDALESIKRQMIFIRDNADNKRNPSDELMPGQKFTYAIIASRELSSPSELKLNNLISEVTRILVKG